jgi:hypothetical protein
MPRENATKQQLILIMTAGNVIVYWILPSRRGFGEGFIQKALIAIAGLE